MTTGFAESADPYRGAGWNPIPLPRGCKASPPQGYTGRNGEVANDAIYTDWKREWADGNVALRLSEDMIGIDIDNYGSKRGALHLEEFAIAHDLSALPPTWVSSSKPAPSGIHLYRLQPLLLKGRRINSELCADVDLIQHNYRYAVVPPSIHPDGNLYVWRDPEGRESLEIPRKGQVDVLPIDWHEAVSTPVGSASGPMLPSGGGGEGTYYSRDQAQIWLSDHPGDGGPWERLFGTVIDRLQIDAIQTTRYSAMRRAVAIVVGDIGAEKMPGNAAFELERECQALYEIPPPGKLAKEFRPGSTKHTDFWNLVAGAVGKYEEGGPWRDRIADDIEAAAITELLRRDGLSMDEVEPIEDEEQEQQAPEPEPPKEPEPKLPPVPQTPLEEFTPEADAAFKAEAKSAAISSAAAERKFAQQVEAAARAGQFSSDEERAFFIEVVREKIDQRRVNETRAAVAEVEFTTQGMQRVVDPMQPRVRTEDLEAWAHEARARWRSRQTLSNVFEPVAHPHWIEGDWLPKGSLVALVSRPSVGKSMVLVDMACRLSLGLPWNGIWVEQTPVLYLAFEAAPSITNRVAAWGLGESNRADLSKVKNSKLLVKRGQLAAPTQVFVADMAGVNLREEGGRREIERHMERIREITGSYPGVVIVDTLAQAFGSGDENSAQAMAELVIEMQRLIVSHPALTILLAHHSRKDQADGQHGEGRGSGALRGAVSVEISLAKVMIDGPDGPKATDFISVKRTKTRDGEAEISFRGKKEIVQLVDGYGTILMGADGIAKTAVVWAQPSPEDDDRLIAEGLSAGATSEIGLRSDLEALGWTLLADIGWVDGQPLPTKGFTRTNLLDLARARGMRATNKTLRPIGDEVIKEIGEEIAARLEKAAPGEPEDGVDG